jgi:hypothetical protein
MYLSTAIPVPVSAAMNFNEESLSHPCSVFPLSSSKGSTRYFTIAALKIGITAGGIEAEEPPVCAAEVEEVPPD